jgi:hypothetical protein
VQSDTVLGLFFILAAVLGYLIGRHKGRPLLGLTLGFFLSYVGLGVMLFVPRKQGPSRQVTAQREQRLRDRRRAPGDVHRGVLVETDHVPPRYRMVPDGPRQWVPPPPYDPSSGPASTVTPPPMRGYWHQPMRQELVAPEECWAKLRSSDGREGWVLADRAIFNFSVGQYVDLSSYIR